MKTASHFITLFLFSCFFNLSIQAQVSPFLTTTWNQTCYYNDSCPTVSSGGACGKAYTGCNATAMAQICKYYAWPVNGMSAHCNTNLSTQCVTFSAQTYTYASMPNNVNSSNAEVAKLMAHLGAACDMQYSGVSSNSFFDATVLKRYFAYSPAMYSSAVFLFNTTQELIDAIKVEINAGRPVYCKGGNHFYLIDGYNAANEFHMNFGWGGTYNGYYPINSVVNGAGTFTPNNFIFMIRPLSGDLEIGQDTIVVTANGGSAGFEFSSTLNWSMTTSASWLTTALTSGASGYYNFSDGNTFTAQVNQGATRYGYVYVQNANDMDTLVIQQDPSPLMTTPDSLHYVDMGGGQNAAIAYLSWATWNASSPDSWITIAPASGTGNGNPLITCSMNPNNTPRMGFVAIAGGVFRDTVWITQDANLSTSIGTNQALYSVDVYPNPGQGVFQLVGWTTTTETKLVVQNTLGACVHLEALPRGKTQVDLSHLADGLYYLHLVDEAGNTCVKQLVITR